MQDWFVRLVEQGGYAGVFLLSLLETLIVPLPSELILPIAGMAAADGPLGLAGVIAASTAGSMTGNILWYLAARSFGLDRLRQIIDRRGRWLALEWRDVERIQRRFDQYGSALVFFGRLVPGVRTLVSLPAGLVRMPWLRFLFWSTAGTGLFAATFASAGYFAGSHLGWIERSAGPASTLVILTLISLYIWRQLNWRRPAGYRLRPGDREAPDSAEAISSPFDRR